MIIASAKAMAEKAAGVPVVDSRFEQPKGEQQVPQVAEPVPPQAKGPAPPQTKGPLSSLREIMPGPVSGKSG